MKARVLVSGKGAGGQLAAIETLSKAVLDDIGQAKDPLDSKVVDELADQMRVKHIEAAFKAALTKIAADAAMKKQPVEGLEDIDKRSKEFAEELVEKRQKIKNKNRVDRCRQRDKQKKIQKAASS